MVEQNLPTKARSEAGWISVPFQERHWHRSVQVRRGTVPSFSVGYGLYTESAQSRGPENIDPERPPSGLLALAAVLSPTRITLENNGKIRPQPDRENAFAGASGGQGGIRTHGRLPPTAVFKTAALNHSATCPARLGTLACIAVKRRVIQAESAGQAEVAAREERVTSQMPPQTRIKAIR